MADKQAANTKNSNAVHAVTSNQDDLYKHLDETVRKYIATRFLRPIADHTREAFEQAKQFVSSFPTITPKTETVPSSSNVISVPSNVIPASEPGSPLKVILDSGCGAGESTLHLAKRFPNVPVIGIDKSAMRLTKAGNIHQQEAAGTDQPSNAFWVRAELLDFWRLALEEVQAGRWNIVHHAVFYPNPWPKEGEAGRRFHLHPIFPTLLALSPVTELRTNWEIYAKEFAAAARIVCADASIACENFNPAVPETAFERKYKEARQQLWRVLIKK
ncbi:MAG: methyltransferase domain-containing protein [Fibrobacter sp.]|nr:methyltransferase domain-containing protein [Fibrobacter sp.]